MPRGWTRPPAPGFRFRLRARAGEGTSASAVLASGPGLAAHPRHELGPRVRRQRRCHQAASSRPAENKKKYINSKFRFLFCSTCSCARAEDLALRCWLG